MKKVNHKLITIIVISVMALALVLLFVFQSGITRKTPKVAAVADNCYDKTLTVITDADYSPYSFYDADGSFSGHDVELITLIANEMKMNLDLRFMNWYEAIDAMNAGEADVLMTCDYSDTFAGVEKLTKSEPVSFDDFIVYSKKTINDSDELYGKRIGIMRNGNVTAQIHMMNLDRCCTEYEDNRKAMQALIRDEIDFAIMRQTVGTVLLKELDAKGISSPLSIGQSYMCFGIRNEELACRINEAIETLKMNGEMSRLHNKWLTTFVKPYSFREFIQNNFLPVALFLVALAGLASWSLISNARKIRREQELREKNQEQQEQLQDALNTANIEAKRNDVVTSIINAARFTYDISPEDEVTGAHYAEISKERIGEKYLDKMDWIKLVHPEDRERVLSEFMACVRDHSGQTLYSTTFRMMATDGRYRWVRSGGNVIRRADGSGEFYGISLDITSQMEEQQKRLLGAIPVSPDILTKANIGLWAFELDGGQPPRMYGDEAMLGLVGLDHQVPPEEMYHAWYDHIDEDAYGLVTDAVSRMTAGEHAEVQYPWHHPDGHTMIVRCGGVRNPEYTKGIRIEGTHQDVSQTLHFDEEERKRAKRLEDELVISTFRADALLYIADHEPDLNAAIDYFGKKILEISGCDQVVFREPDGHRIVLNAPGIKDVPQKICAKCPFAKFDSNIFGEDGTVLMNDCRQGYNGVKAPEDCPAKSTFMQMIYSGGKLVGKLTVHYLKEYHTFSENSIDIMKTVAVYLGLMIGRVNEKKAELARIEAESSSKAKTEFLFNMSHDIRTPMNAITGFTDQAIKHRDEPEIRDSALEKVRDSGAYLLRLINDILDMAKIESGKLELNEELHYIDSSKNSLLEVLGAEAARKGIDFHISGSMQDRYLWLDVNRTNQIIANLLSNAIKYTEPGGEIWYSVEQLPCDRHGFGKFVVSVRDTGCGMSPEFLTKIFNAFERSNSAKRSGAQGTGLGMAIVKKLADAMGASVDIQSEPGKGTTVTFTSEHRIATQEEIDAFLEKNGDGVRTAEFDFTGKKVLLVEDNELNREIANDILEDAGFVIENADDGTTAVEMLKEKGPEYYDFILMDIQMPVMNGYEATKTIREMYPDSCIPIIALSANAFAEDKATSLASGMNDHVAKPININELFSVLAKYL